MAAGDADDLLNKIDKSLKELVEFEKRPPPGSPMDLMARALKREGQLLGAPRPFDSPGKRYKAGGGPGEPADDTAKGPSPFLDPAAFFRALSKAAQDASTAKNVPRDIETMVPHARAAYQPPARDYGPSQTGDPYATNTPSAASRESVGVPQERQRHLYGMDAFLAGPGKFMEEWASGEYEHPSKGRRINEGLGQLGAGLTKSDGAGGLAEVVGGFGRLASLLPKVGGPVGGLAKLGEVAIRSVEKLQEWTNSLHGANMQFAEFSESMGEVQAEQEVREFELSRERGERRAESAKGLAEAKNKLDVEMASVADALANLKNNLVAGLDNLLADTLGQQKKNVNRLRELLEEIEAEKRGITPDEYRAEQRALKGAGAGPGQVATELYDVSGGDWAARWGRNPRL